MVDIARMLTAILVQRWKAVRSDEGATALEYAIIAAVGFAVAGAIALAVQKVVTHDAGSITVK